MHRLTEIKALPHLRLRLHYADGTEGEVDVSHLAGKGVFACWREAGEFEKVSVGPTGEAVWACGVDLCPDALYMQLTGKQPEEVFPSLTGTRSHA